MNEPLPWLILFLPLLSAVLITLFLQQRPALQRRPFRGRGSGFVSASSVDLLAQYLADGRAAGHFAALGCRSGHLNIDFGLHFDAVEPADALDRHRRRRSAIHIYSIGYMKGDPAYARFFACLSLFTFSMLGIVAEQQFFPDVHFLGIGRRFQLSAHRLLV